MGERSGGNSAVVGGGAIYGLGIFGAGFYFFGQADGFWEVVWAFFQGSSGPRSWSSTCSRP